MRQLPCAPQQTGSETARSENVCLRTDTAFIIILKGLGWGVDVS
jgi:hypothetical protein